MQNIEKIGNYYYGTNINNKKYILPILDDDIVIYQIDKSIERKLICYYSSNISIIIFKDYCINPGSKYTYTLQRSESLNTFKDAEKYMSYFDILKIILIYMYKLDVGSYKKVTCFDKPEYKELADKLESFIKELK